jgi:hypothetical protein
VSGEQRTWSLAIFLVCVSLVASIAIMAQCSVREVNDQVRAADCVKRGGTWHADTNAGIPFCEDQHK